MKKILAFLFVSLFSTKSYSQWQAQVGLNLLPLSVSSFEVSSEFRKNSRLSVTANAGYLHRSRYEGISGSNVYDGVINRQTSGVSLKLGGRFYTFRTIFENSKVQGPAANIFIGASLISSWYHKKADYFDLKTEPDPSIIYHADKKGILWGPALTAGLTVRLASTLHLDTGIQYAFMVNGKGKNIGYGSFNYEPGFGASKSPLMMMAVPPFAIFATHSQAIVTLKYRL
jgi:hypothetical protein